MTTRTDQRRRAFIKGAVLTTAIALMPYTRSALAQAGPDIPAGDLPPVQVLPTVVTIRGSLYEKSVRLIKLQPGVTSDAVSLTGNGAYRVRITPDYIHRSGEQVYTVTLIDAKSGATLDEMRAVGNMSATFTKYGVQVYLGPSPDVVKQQWQQATQSKQS